MESNADLNFLFPKVLFEFVICAMIQNVAGTVAVVFLKRSKNWQKTCVFQHTSPTTCRMQK